MKIYLLGEGRKVTAVFEALAGRSSDLFVVTPDGVPHRNMPDMRAHRIPADPISLDFASLASPPGPDDLVILAETDEARLRSLIQHVRAEKVPGTILAFTSLHGKKLVREFPDILFKSDREIFRRELRELIRRNDTIRKVAELRTLIKTSPRLLILLWGNPDPDALGAAAGLRELFRDDVTDLQIAYTGEFTRSENRAMARLLRIPARKLAPGPLPSGTLVATVDAQPSFFPPGSAPPIDIVIDHHPLTDLGGTRFSDVRPEYGSTSSILTEYFVHTKRRLPRQTATALFYGLRIDTNNLTRHVSDADIEAFRDLRTIADSNALRIIELSQMPAEVLDAFAAALPRRKISKNVAFCYLGRLDNPDTAVFIADFLIKVSEITWAVVAARTSDKLIVILRSDGHGKHAGELAEALFSPFGTAGGHRTMARAELSLQKLAAETDVADDEKNEMWLIRKLSDVLKPLSKYAK